jgi:hypothetical protein
MGNLIDLPNITFDSLVVEGQNNKTDKKTSAFDAKNYLNTRLSDGETEKKLTIRLLPMDLKTGNPFVVVHTHNVKVPQTLVKTGEKPYKTYICLAKNADIDHDKYGSKCPFCEINKRAYQESTKETDPVMVKSLKEISLANLSRESVICRCIERGKEDEGVKFWKFNIRADKTDPYNQILNLVNLRKETAERKGKVENILDIYNGRDLTITITEGFTSAPTIVDDIDRSPLSENEELMKKWIYDTKKWQDVFTCKPYEYLSLVSQMKTPWFDRNNNIWVDKDEYDGVSNSATDEINSDLEDARKMISNISSTQVRNSDNSKSDFIKSITMDDDDDMPF